MPSDMKAQGGAMPEKKKRAPTVTEQLKEAIRTSGASLMQLSRDSGVSQPQLSRFMLGQRTLTLPAVDKLCAALGLHLARSRRPRPKGSEAE
jgi:transcriptional regulator with XRE-family HTH domain